MKSQKIIGYIRVSTDKQDLVNQKNQILQYAQKNQLIIYEFIEISISSRKSDKDRKIDVLFEKLSEDDIVICTELSRLGRNFFGVINLIQKFIEMNIKIVFIRQPELSMNSEHSKLLISIYSYLASAERQMISDRVKAALQAKKAKGMTLGRPKGSKNKKESIFDSYKYEIQKYLDMNLSKKAIHTLINDKSESNVSYSSFHYWLRNNYA